ncbi:MAG: hypothetical protein LBS89_01805 [Zoogloeaceae bacterium]|jgi:hypothetical protein|nr:hypothetical protein [Zoogloeaceae bacterium]
MTSDHEYKSRTRMTPLRVAGMVWIVGISAGVMVHQAMLSEVKAQLGNTVQTTQLMTLQTRLTDQEEALRQFQQTPSLSLSRYEDERQILEERLLAIEGTTARLDALDVGRRSFWH